MKIHVVKGSGVWSQCNSLKTKRNKHKKSDLNQVPSGFSSDLGSLMKWESRELFQEISVACPN
jgi:hypothetical protein